MSQRTGINYVDVSWNPIVMRCTPVSDACTFCWHLAMCKRHAANPFLSEELRAARGGGPPVLIEKELNAPMRWRKPRKVAVQFMGDLWHPDVDFADVTAVFDAMCSWRWPSKAAARKGDESQLVDPGHTFFVLTKRPERILSWLNWVDERWPGESPFQQKREHHGGIPPHILMGVTAENQEWLEKRWKYLSQIPTRLWLSLEPLLGPCDLDTPYSPGVHALGCGGDCDCQPKVSFVVIGCESGPGRRPCKDEWALDLLDQCWEAQVPVWLKQFEINGRVEHDANVLAAHFGTTTELIRQLPKEMNK